jgi:hypothetical protein
MNAVASDALLDHSYLFRFFFFRFFRRCFYRQTTAAFVVLKAMPRRALSSCVVAACYRMRLPSTLLQNLWDTVESGEIARLKLWGTALVLWPPVNPCLQCSLSPHSS